jgi:hypothetical protein
MEDLGLKGQTCSRDRDRLPIAHIFPECRVLCHFCFSSAKNTKQLRPTSQFRYRYRLTTRPARSLTRDNAGFGQTEECVSAVTTDIAAGAAKTRASAWLRAPLDMSHYDCARPADWGSPAAEGRRARISSRVWMTWGML